MKRLLTLLTLVTLMTATSGVLAQEELIVANGTATSSYFPLYGGWLDAYCHSQMVYPADMLAEMENGEISQMKFYLSNLPSDPWTSTFTVRLWTISYAVNYSGSNAGYLSISNATIVYVGTVSVSNNTMTVVFDTPFEYYGGNLVVDFQNTKANWCTASFYGVNTTNNASCYAYNSSASPAVGDGVAFLPKCTFTFTPLDVTNYCFSPRDISVTDIVGGSAGLIWADPYNVTATYEVQCISGTDTQTYSNITAKAYTVSGLAVNTVYTFRVRCMCSDTNASSWISAQAAPECAARSVPYAYGFEDAMVGEMPYCWLHPTPAVGTSSNMASIRSDYTTSAHSGSRYLYFDKSSASGNIVVLPDIAGGINGRQLRFWRQNSDTLDVGYMTDATDENTFVKVQSFSSEYVYREDEVPFDNTPQGARMALRHRGDGNAPYCYVDDITVEDIPTCVRPVSLTYSAHTFESMRLHWVDTVGVGSYEVAYSTVNDINDTAIVQPTIITGITDTFVDLTGLQSGTNYYVWVRSVCSAADKSIWRILGSYIQTPYSCYNISNFKVDNVNMTSAHVSWSYNGYNYSRPETGIHFQLLDTAGAVVREWEMAKADGTNTFITGLESGQNYTLRVRTLCDPDSSSYTSYSIVTPNCGEGLSEAGYSNTNISDYRYPMYYGSTYSVCQSIYPASVVGGMSQITGISYQLDNDGNNYIHTFNTFRVKVYVGRTGLDGYSSANDAVGFGSQTLVASEVLVSISSDSTWVTIPFDTPYTISGSDNVVVTVLQDYCSNTSRSVKWKVHQCGSGTTLYRSGAISTADAFNNASMYAYRPNIRFIGDCGSTCIAPNIAIDDVEATSVTLRWAHGMDETVWAVQYRADSSDVWITAATVADTIYTITNLAANTMYRFRVGSVCGAQKMWSSSMSATTDCEPLHYVPYSEDFNNDVSYSLCWIGWNAPWSTTPVNPMVTNFAWSRSTGSVMPTSAIKTNVFSTVNRWAISPAITISESAMLGFEVAFSAWNSNSAANYSNATTRFIVAASTDDGTTWEPLKQWGSDTSRDDYPMTDLTVTPKGVEVPIKQYIGQTIRIAFYVGNTESGGDNDIWIDNVSISPMPQHTISLMADDTASGHCEGAGIFEAFDNYTIEAVANYGYHFAYWSDGDTTNPRQITLTADITLSAHFAKNTYSVTVESDNEAAGYVSSQYSGGVIEYLSSVWIAANAYNGYHFVRWSDGDSTVSREIVITQDTVLRAEFAKNRYTIVCVSSDTTRGTVSGGGEVDYRDTLTLTAVPNYGYQFAYWIDTAYYYYYYGSYDMQLDYSYQNPLDITATGNKTYTAYFSPVQFTVSASGEHGYVDKYAYNNYTYLSSVVLMPQANYGYHFAHWSDGDESNPREFVITSDTSFTAIFECNSYTLSFRSADTTKGIVNVVSVDGLYLDSTVAVTATPLPHYHFLSWNDGSSENPRRFLITGDAVYTASFAIDVHTVTVQVDDMAHGSVTGGGNFTYGTSATVSATAYSGFEFSHWSDGSPYNPYTFAVLQDKQLTAIFTADGEPWQDTLVIYDTAYIVMHDTVYQGQPIHDTIVVIEYDTVVIAIDTVIITDTVWLHDTVHVHDTIYVPQDGIADVGEAAAKIYSNNGQIVVEGIYGVDVHIYDALGRQIEAVKRPDSQTIRFNVPSTGTYMVKIGNAPARRIVVVR